jgi:hypothetical protein
MKIYLDLETIGATDTEMVADITASLADDLATDLEAVKAPSNYKDEAKIADYIRNRQEELRMGHAKKIEDTIAKTSFDGALGQIVCIGYAVDNVISHAYCLADERYLLTKFFEDLTVVMDANHTQPIFVGHNILDFDLRFIWQRAVINGIKPPAGIPFNAKPWDDSVFDTMTRWNPDKSKRISLDKLCRSLKVPTPKGDFDGSMVWDAFKAGELNKIAAYCAKDVEAVRQCHKRMTFE